MTQQPPASVTAGSAFGLTVEAEDSSGNLVSSFNGTVTVALANNPGGATLGGTLTATASNGVATFSGFIAHHGRVRLHARCLRERPRRGRHQRDHRDARGAPASGDHRQQPPASVTAGSGFGLQATIEDTYGNVVTADSNIVTRGAGQQPGRRNARRHTLGDRE